jgi:hypothetical protein
MQKMKACRKATRSFNGNRKPTVNRIVATVPMLPITSPIAPDALDSAHVDSPTVMKNTMESRMWPPACSRTGAG